MTDLFKRKKRLQELKRSHFSDVKPEDIKINLLFCYSVTDYNIEKNYIQKVKAPLTKIFQENIRPNLVNIAKKLCIVDFNIQISISFYHDNHFYFKYALFDKSKNILGELAFYNKIPMIIKNNTIHDKDIQHQGFYEYLDDLKSITSHNISFFVYAFIANSENNEYEIYTSFKQKIKIHRVYNSIYDVFQKLKAHNILDLSSYSQINSKASIYIGIRIGTDTFYFLDTTIVDKQIMCHQNEVFSIKNSEINYKHIMNFLFNYNFFDKSIESHLKDLDKDSYFECLKLLTY